MTFRFLFLKILFIVSQFLQLCSW